MTINYQLAIDSFATIILLSFPISLVFAVVTSSIRILLRAFSGKERFL